MGVKCSAHSDSSKKKVAQLLRQVGNGIIGNNKWQLHILVAKLLSVFYVCFDAKAENLIMGVAGEHKTWDDELKI
jgi:hypothetical protein